jgi:predicted SAM-dependent methyltransferase
MASVKINIGCGLDAYPGWHNYDNSPTILLSRLPFGQRIFRTPPWPRSVIRLDVTKKDFPFSENSVDCIYSSHAFEHLTYDASLNVARRCYRVLRPGGVIRIAVPDLGRIVQDYLKNPEPLASHQFLHRTGIVGMQMFWRSLLHPGASHRQMFDERSLRHMLREAGFPNPEQKQFGESRIPDIAAIELPNRAFESLYVEAAK